MQKNIWILLLVAVVSLVSACKNDDPLPVDNNVLLRFVPKVGNVPLALNTPYTNAAGIKYRIDRLAFYVDNITLVANDGTEHLVKDLDLIEAANLQDIIANLPEGNYTAIKLGVGLDSTNNAISPIDGTGVLSFAYDEFWWSWASKHIFSKIEGDVEQVAGSNNFNMGLVYHLGFDDLYQVITIPRAISLSKTAVTEIPISVQVDKILDGNNDQLNLLTEYTTQTFDNFDLALRVRNNFAASFD